MTRILGIDPGSRATGWALVEASGSRSRLIACGVLRPKGKGRVELLADLAGRLRDIVAEMRPDCGAVESSFSGVHAKSALALAESRGVVLAVLGESGFPVSAYPPARVKATIVGRGAATKEQIGFMVVRLLNLDRSPATDAADAIAVALTHQRLAGWERRVAAGRSAGG